MFCYLRTRSLVTPGVHDTDEEGLSETFHRSARRRCFGARVSTNAEFPVAFDVPRVNHTTVASVQEAGIVCVCLWGAAAVVRPGGRHHCERGSEAGPLIPQP